MGVLRNRKEKSENLRRKARMERSEKKNRPPKKDVKKKPSLRLTIPSRRGSRKK